MPRQLRIEFAGAMYHVMARGDRREAIVLDDEDRRTFVRTLGEASERAGFRVHAYVLMSNHYHLLIETPEPNLSRGMGWLQNAYTRRVNTRHKLWGHVFGGRYKSIVVEPGNCFWALMDYIHLNPVRARMVSEGDGLEAFPWSSLSTYVASPSARPDWLETGLGLKVCGCEDTATGRRGFLEALERRVDWKRPTKAGAVYSEGEGAPELAVHSALRRGWFFGSQKFKEKLLKLLPDRKGLRKRADGYNGDEVREHGEEEAESILAAGLVHFGISLTELQRCRKGDARKAQIAEIIQSKTTVRLDWITARLQMGTRSSCCRLVRRVRDSLVRSRSQRKQREVIVAKVSG